VFGRLVGGRERSHDGRHWQEGAPAPAQALADYPPAAQGSQRRADQPGSRQFSKARPLYLDGLVGRLRVYGRLGLGQCLLDSPVVEVVWRPGQHLNERYLHQRFHPLTLSVRQTATLGLELYEEQARWSELGTVAGDLLMKSRTY